MAQGSSVFVGIDVSKAFLDVHVRPARRSFRVTRDETGLAQLVAELTPLTPELVVMEATGKLEAPVAATLLHAQLQVAVVNPRQVRDFAKALGKLSKTDRLDAEVLAHFAEAVRPEVRPLVDDQTRALRALVDRRTQLIEMHGAEKQRLAGCEKVVRKQIQGHITWLEKRISQADDDIEKMMKQSQLFKEKEALYRTVPAVGPVTAAVLIAELPELGTLTNKEIAALVGVAPLARDSGTLKGKRTVWGGRAVVRKTLYMTALVATKYNPVIARFYARLVGAGKSKKLALVACMRKLLTILNAMAKAKQPWRLATSSTP